MPLTTILFDLDDTLCDTIGCRVQRLQTAVARLVSDYPHLEGAWLIERAMQSGGEPRAVRGLRQVLQELDLSETVAGREALRLFAIDYRPLVLLADVLPTLRRLSRHYRLGVITNGDEQVQRETLHHLGLAPYIHGLTTSGAVAYEKPDRRIFVHALAEMGAERGEAAFVGDRLDIDIGGAQAAGIRAIWFNHWGGRLTPDSPQPDAVINHFAELSSALSRLHGSWG